MICIVTDDASKKRWTDKFLKDAHGFKHIKDMFFRQPVNQIAQEHLKDTAFWATLIQNNFEGANLKPADRDLLTRRSLDLLHHILREETEFYTDVDGKMIIENSLMSFTKAVTKAFGLFEAFTANDNPRDRDLTKKGTFNKELRVRYAFRDNLIRIPRQLAGRE